MTDNVWRLDVAVEKTYAEFNALNDDYKNPLSVTLLARKYSPKTAKQIADCFSDEKNETLVFLEARPGHLIIDVLTANICDIIATRVMQMWSETMKIVSAEQTRQESLRKNLLRH